MGVCPIAHDRHFIDKYIAGRVYDRAAAGSLL